MIYSDKSIMPTASIASLIVRANSPVFSISLSLLKCKYSVIFNFQPWSLYNRISVTAVRSYPFIFVSLIHTIIMIAVKIQRAFSFVFVPFSCSELNWNKRMIVWHLLLPFIWLYYLFCHPALSPCHLIFSASRIYSHHLV